MGPVFAAQKKAWFVWGNPQAAENRSSVMTRVLCQDMGEENSIFPRLVPNFLTYAPSIYGIRSDGEKNPLALGTAG
jgi:hypothetical protein